MQTITLERLFHARRPDVLAAWLDAERLARWLRPLSGVEVVPRSCDARAGGGFELELRAADGRSGSLCGAYRTLQPPGVLELALTVVLGGRSLWNLEGVRVELLERGQGTLLRLVQPLVEGQPRAELEAAWRQCLDRLPSAFDEALDAFYGRLERYPRFFSRFGGLWPDLSDARERLAGKRALGRLDARQEELFAHWMEHGYVRLPGAVAPPVVDALAADVERLWRGEGPEVRAEVFRDGQRSFERCGPRTRAQPHKLLDLHGALASAREAIFAPAIRAFLEELFERPPLAFQSLYFTYGTQQELHQDTAYVVLRSPLEFCGCWIALEDVAEGSGELEYFAGSHRIPEYLWLGRGRAKPYDLADDADFLRWVREEPERRGLRRERLLARKGDALLWHADLVHGGSRVTRPGTTRRSLVAHFAPADVDPEYFGTGEHSPKLVHAPGALYCFCAHP